MNKSLSNWKNKFKVGFNNLVAAGKGIERLKIYFDVLVILVMVWAVFVSRDANQIAREALQKQDTPWLQIRAIGVDDRANVHYTLINFSDAPALKLKIDLLIPHVIQGTNTYSEDTLMPHDSGSYSFDYTGSDATELAKSIKEGGTSLSFRISYESIQGQQIIINQEVRWVNDMFRDTKYEVKGM